MLLMGKLGVERGEGYMDTLLYLLNFSVTLKLF